MVKTTWHLSNPLAIEVIQGLWKKNGTLGSGPLGSLPLDILIESLKSEDKFNVTHVSTWAKSTMRWAAVYGATELESLRKTISEKLESLLDRQTESDHNRFSVWSATGELTMVEELLGLLAPNSAKDHPMG